MIDTLYCAKVLSKLLAGQSVNGHLKDLPQPWLEIGENLLATPILSERSRAFEAALAGLPNSDTIRQQVLACDPAKDLPPIDENGPAEHPRIVRRTAADALQPQPPIDWVIEGVFSAGSLSVIVGPPGSKKTFAMLSAAVCTAIGKAWLGHKTKSTKVLIIDEESGFRRMSRRLGDVLRGEGGDQQTGVEFVSLAQFNFRDVGDVLLFHALIEESGAGLVVIDALADVMPGADENAVRDIQPVLMALRKVADETKAAIVLIHHTNKVGGYRGSTAISGAVDLLLTVDSKQGASNVDFESEKTRDTEPFRFSAAAHFSPGSCDIDTFEVIPGSFHLTESQPVDRGNQPTGKPENYVFRFLEDHNGQATVREICSSPDICSSSSARQAIYRLADKGLIHRCDLGGRSDDATYRIKYHPGTVEDDE